MAPVLVSLGFFLSVLSPKAERPNGLINLIDQAALLLASGWHRAVPGLSPLLLPDPWVV